MDGINTAALILLLPASAVFAWLAGATLKGARDGVDWGLGIYFALVVLGIGGAALQIVANDAITLAVAKVFMFVCRACIPVALIAMVFDLMGRPFRGRAIVALSVLPAFTLILALTNSTHGLVWSPDLADNAGELIINPAWGPWYRFAHAPYSYLLLGCVMVLFFLRLPAVSAPQRRSILLFLLISLGPMFTGLLHTFGFDFGRLWLPAVSVALTSPVFLWIVGDLRNRRFRPVSYRELMEQIDDPLIGLDLTGRIVSINQAASELFGRKVSKLLGGRLPPESPITVALSDALSSGKPMDHQGRRYEVRRSEVMAEDGSRRGETLICRDVTAELRARDELSTSEQLMRTMVEHSSYGIVRLRREEPANDKAPIAYRCVFANAAAAAWAGVEASEWEGQDITRILEGVLAPWRGNHERFVKRLLKTIAAGEVAEKELSMGSDHDGRWLRLVAEPVDQDVVLTLTDITEPMRRQLAAERRASHDHLTGILNRHGFLEAANSRISASEGGVLLFVDLNGFKQVNDTLGHQAGDRLLQRVASRLLDTCRQQDLVGRYGGDEFVVLAGNLDQGAEEVLIERVTRAMSRPYDLGQQDLECTASIGRARFPEHGATLEALLDHADSDMYREKRASTGSDERESESA
ncbi:MAG: diguanylate cyclase [Pseudomonadota bacterium]